MFSKLIDNPDLPPKDQKDVLKDILANNVKKNIHEVRLQFNHNYPKLKPILTQHWRYALRLALALHSWQVSAEMLQGKKDTQAVDLLYTVLGEDQRARGQVLMVEFTKTFQDNWRLLVILSIAAELIVPQLVPQDYSWLLASFVRTSATVIQGYLTLKNEPAKSNDDRIESDLKLITNCEQWITSAFVGMIKALKCPETEVSKQIVLAAFSQICGALLQNEKDGQLSVEKLKQIELVAGQYITSCFSLKEVRQAFLQQLQMYNYGTRLKKIEIPDQYISKSEFSKEGICWLILLFLNTHPCCYSEQYQLECLLVAYSETLESFLHIKDQALLGIKKILDSHVSASAVQINYPFGLFLFNVYHSQRGELSYFKEKLFGGSDVSTNLRRYRRLLNIDLGTLNVDKISLVVEQLSKEEIQDKQILLVIKALQFDFTNQELNKSVLSLLSSVDAVHPSGKRIISQVIAKERLNNRNVELCGQIEHNLAH